MLLDCIVICDCRLVTFHLVFLPWELLSYFPQFKLQLLNETFTTGSFWVCMSVIRISRSHNSIPKVMGSVSRSPLTTVIIQLRAGLCSSPTHHVLIRLGNRNQPTPTVVLQDYSVNFYLRQQWRDIRLHYTPPSKRYEVIKLEGDMWTRIWTPDTFFRNEKKASFHDITVFNRLLRLNCTGVLWYVTK